MARGTSACGAKSPTATNRRLSLFRKEYLQLIPDYDQIKWLQPEDGLPDPDAHRRAYVDYLLARLEGPRAFVAEADRARTA